MTGRGLWGVWLAFIVVLLHAGCSSSDLDAGGNARDACSDETCDAPPPARCVDETTIETHAGACEMGQCRYAPTTSKCAETERCVQGSCLWDEVVLTGLEVTGGIAFDPTQSHYVVTMPSGADAVSVTATLRPGSEAALAIGGDSARSGTAVTLPFPVTERRMTVEVRVSAPSGASLTYRILVLRTGQQAYVKASNAGSQDFFGTAVALSGDGQTLAVGAHWEDGNATGVQGVETNNTSTNSGAVYVFARTAEGTWAQQAYVKASNTGSQDFFGAALSLSWDGDTLAVGAYQESSDATGVNGDQANDEAPYSGAVYVFARSAEGVWAQRAYVKASNTEGQDSFGAALSLSGDGSTLVVGAPGEDSNARGVNGDGASDTASNSGAAYVFSRSAEGVWAQQAYVKASNTGAGDAFGRAVSLSWDGETLAVGADGEGSQAMGVNGDGTNNAAPNSGAVYVFSRSEGGWTQQAYVKASNTGSNDRFGIPLSLSGDGHTLAVGAAGEDSGATGIDGDGMNDTASNSGAVYVFARSAEGAWGQQAYVKASNTGSQDFFGTAVALSRDGRTLVVGATGEGSGATGLDGDGASDTASNSGAVYVFARSAEGVWAQRVYVKASNTGAGDAFGRAVSLSGDGRVLAVGAEGEGSGATGLDGDEADNTSANSGAVYVFAL